MLSNYAHSFCKAMYALTKLAQDLNSRKAVLNDDEFRRYVCELRMLRGQCEFLGLEATVDKIDRIIMGGAATLEHDLEELVRICIADLRSRQFLYVERSRASEYYDSLAEWANILGGPAIASVPDGENASKCYALGMPTACVFHLMRVMEVLVKLLSDRLGVSRERKDGREKTWGQLLTEMQPKVNGFDALKVAKERRAFYSEAVAHFTAVNIAWRTDTIHAHPHQFAKEYSDAEAYDILRNVKTFGKHFCEGYDKYS